MPSQKEFQLGEIFEAKIYLVAFDTTNNPIITVENIELTVINGVGHYKKRITQTNIGKVIENGELEIVNPATEELMVYPFTVKYEVVE